MIKGRVWRYGDHVNTDLIIPGRYLDNYDMSSLATHAMEDIDTGFASAVRPGDVIVAGRNFGCGSSREQAPLVLKELGVGAVVAESFARIFYRNAINVGLPVIICAEAASLAKGEEVEVDLRAGTITGSNGLDASFPPLPGKLLEILEKGGLVEAMKQRFRPCRPDTGPL